MGSSVSTGSYSVGADVECPSPFHIVGSGVVTGSIGAGVGLGVGFLQSEAMSQMMDE